MRDRDEQGPLWVCAQVRKNLSFFEMAGVIGYHGMTASSNGYTMS